MKFTFSPVVLSEPLQISLSTAEDSANYFSGHESSVRQGEKGRLLPVGVYRIIDDQLFQIVDAPRIKTKQLPQG